VVLAIRRNRVYVLYLFVLAAVYVLGYFLSATASLGVETALLLGGQIILLPVSVLLPIPVLWVWRRRGSLDALLLAIPLLVRAVISFDNLWRVVTEVLFHRHSALLPPLISYVSWFEVSDITFILTLLLFIVVRTIRIVRARADLAAEVHAAQSVQQLLLNRSNQATPGFAVETVYLPAAEVGGDFFLVSPGEDGSLVAVVGDVSGKGLTAAMRVSMILGVLRRESSRNPAQVLFALNEALLSQGELGFTTACCALLLPDGFYTIANAGHINPYLDGRELETAPALPLGLAPDQHYANLSGRLAPSQTLVLLTDGIPEARNAKGELYGFEALGTLTREPASRIAAAAQRFGQEDDITVLTLALA
jgi:hypothetical protein